MDLSALRRGFAGEIVEPASGGYDELRRSFNAMVDRRPALIASCASETDVVAALTFGRERGLPIAVRGGGHSVAGHGLVEGGLVIDLRRMRGVEIDAGARTARVQGGATWEDFDTAAQREGLAVTGGTFVDTGVAGLTLGGGIGYLMGVCGLTCDNLVGARLVTADGRSIDVDASSEPELLWALRGGGGNFGIATRLDFRLHPVGTLHGDVVLAALEDGRALERLARVQRDAPDELTALAYVANREEFGPSISIQVVSLLGEAATRPIYDEIVGDATVIDAEFGELTYAEVQGFAGIMPFGLRHYWKSAFVPELSGNVVAEIVRSVEGRPAGKTGVLLEPLHGAARSYGFDHAAFPQREARYHVSALGIWLDAANDDREIAWVRDVHRRVTDLGTTGTYVNYVAPDEPVDRATSTWPPDVLARLRRVKTRLDPENIFRSNLNITPTKTPG